MRSIPYFFLAALPFFMGACAYMPVKADFTTEATPPTPDYSDAANWCALPDKKDSADHIPSQSPEPLFDGQQNASADVFYLYPTQFFTRKAWNASTDDAKLNRRVDEGAITHQASVFNGSCRVFAPRYRQVTYNGYFSLDDPDAQKAFALAYTDVRAAFEYYLQHYNNGRPIIIAGHSQGTTHAKWLLRDYFDGKPLQSQLVGAYLVGMPVYAYDLMNIPPCDSAGQTGCYISWRSYLEDTRQPEKFLAENRDAVVVHNPLNFSRDSERIAPQSDDGGLGRDGETIYPQVCSAEIHEDILWVTRPEIPGKLFIPRNLHVADYNLYWLSIRNNVALQVGNFGSGER